MNIGDRVTVSKRSTVFKYYRTCVIKKTEGMMYFVCNDDYECAWFTEDELQKVGD